MREVAVEIERTRVSVLRFIIWRIYCSPLIPENRFDSKMSQNVGRARFFSGS